MISSLRRAVLIVLLAALALSHNSCAVIAWLAAQFSPPEKVAPEYQPARGKTILVFVDDVLNPVSYEPIKIELANLVGEHLLAAKVAGKTIPYSRLADLIASTPKFNLLAVSEVGQRLGADIVLYVQIDEFALRDRSARQLWRGKLRTTVRLVDVEAGRLWPTDRPAGHVLPAVETPTTVETSSTQADEITRSLAGQMSDQIAKLFYEHKRPRRPDWSPQDQ